MGPRSTALLLKLLNFSCSRCSFPSDHSDHLLVNINTRPMASRLCPLQCCAAEAPSETDVDASNPRPGAAAGSLSRGQSARSFRTRLIEIRQMSNSTTSVEQSGVHTTTEGPRNGGEMVGDGFKALPGPTRRRGGRREGGRNG